MLDCKSVLPDKNETNRLPFLRWFIVLWTLALTVWIYIFSIRQGGAPNWDEYERLAWTSEIWINLKNGDFYQFWRHTNSQVIWPFLHSWITAFLFLVFGPSVASARLLSLGAFTGSGLLIFSIVSRQKFRYSWLGGVLAWCLFTTAPIVVQNAASIMSEMSGLFLVLLVLIFLPQKGDREKIGPIWAATLFLSLLFFYKYNYALLTWSALLLHRFVFAGYSLRRMAVKGNGILFGLPVFALAIWFLPYWDYKTQHFLNFLTNNPAARTPLGLDFFLYYPRQIPAAYYSFPWLFYASAAAVLSAFFLSKRMRFSNPFVACFVVHFLAAVVHPMKMERFQFIPMALFFILTGEALEIVFSRCLDRFQVKSPTASYVSIVLCAAMLIPAVQLQSRLYRSPQTRQGSTLLAPLQAILDRVETDDRIALLITHDLACTPSVNYYYISGLNRSTADLRNSFSRWRQVFLYQSKEEILSLDLEERIRKLRDILKENKDNKIVVLECTKPELIGYYEKMYGGTQEVVRLVSLLPEFALVYENEFPKEFARVSIYARKERDTTEKTQRSHE